MHVKSRKEIQITLKFKAHLDVKSGFSLLTSPSFPPQFFHSICFKLLEAAPKKKAMALLEPFPLQASYSEDVFVDQLLDFGNEEGLCENHEVDDEKALPGEETCVAGAALDCPDEFYYSLGELEVPVDELESLEWLSEFVDDSKAEYAILQAKDNARAEPAFQLPVPARPRSKGSRARARGVRVSPVSSSSSGSSRLSHASPRRGRWAAEPASKPSHLKERRCLHCGVQRTPQWRAGPHGAKTLCNACGVRYKSGRLLPEYRPACSPTYCSELHSNSHRKVLEMRKRNLANGSYDVGTLF